jgi:hypothetical protein
MTLLLFSIGTEKISINIMREGNACEGNARKSNACERNACKNSACEGNARKSNARKSNACKEAVPAKAMLAIAIKRERKHEKKQNKSKIRQSANTTLRGYQTLHGSRQDSVLIINSVRTNTAQT